MVKRIFGATSVVLAFIACFALSKSRAQAVTAPPPYWRAFDPVALWQRASHSVPLPPELVVELGDAFKVSCSGSGALTPAGCIVTEEVPTEDAPPPTTTPPVRRLLPIYHLSRAKAAEVARRQATMGLFLGAIKRLSPAQLEGLSTMADPLPYAFAAQVELLGMTMAEFLAGENKQSKCEAYRSVQSHARSLGWLNPAPGQTIIGRADVAAGWADLTSSVLSVYQTRFLPSVPASICELRPITDRATIFARLHDTAERTIRTRTRLEVERTLNTYTTARTRYASLLSRAQIPVPTDTLFSLRQSVSDSGALFAFVSGDPEGFWNDRDGRGSLLAQLSTALVRVRGATTANLESPEEVAAKQTLSLYRTALDRVSTKLRAIAVMSQLSPASKARLATCVNVSSPAPVDSGPGAPLDTAAIAAMQTCLLSITDLYRDLKLNTSPDKDEFGAKVQHLSSAFMRVLQ